MGNLLRDRHDVSELAASGQVIEINEEIGSFEGLANIIESDLAALEADKIPAIWRNSAVRGELRFEFADDRGHVPVLTGSAAATVDARCQRCLEPFRLSLEVEPELLLLQHDAEANGFDDYEVWELDGATMRPLDLVEELLIMAMPFSAMHDNMAECRAFASDDDECREERVRPFAALRAQMAENENDPD